MESRGDGNREPWKRRDVLHELYGVEFKVRMMNLCSAVEQYYFYVTAIYYVNTYKVD